MNTAIEVIFYSLARTGVLRPTIKQARHRGNNSKSRSQNKATYWAHYFPSALLWELTAGRTSFSIACYCKLLNF